jgi:hypothetical protein
MTSMDSEVKAARASFRGSLEFRVTYKIETTSARPRPWGRGDVMYLPDKLAFGIECASEDDGALPRYENLRTGTVALSGFKLKKDGTPGQLRAHEVFYSGNGMPDWAEKLVEQTVRELKETK